MKVPYEQLLLDEVIPGAELRPVDYKDVPLQPLVHLSILADVLQARCLKNQTVALIVEIYGASVWDQESGYFWNFGPEPSFTLWPKSFTVSIQFRLGKAVWGVLPLLTPNNHML